MQIAKKRNFAYQFKNARKFIDVESCKEYIKHSQQSDNCGFSITLQNLPVFTMPISFQLIVDFLETANDRKFFEIRYQDGSYPIRFHIIASGLRTSFRSKADSTGEDYPFAGGWYDGRKGNIVTSLGKHNFICDGDLGECMFDGNRIQDISTLEIPDQTYYFGFNTLATKSQTGEIPTRLQIMALDGDSGALYCKFYALRLIDGTGNILIDLRPYVNGSSIGIKNLVDNNVYYSNIGSGSFQYGID